MPPAVLGQSAVALLPDGRSVNGEVVTRPDGILALRSDDGYFNLAATRHVRFHPAPIRPAAGVVFRAELDTGEIVHGVPVRLTEQGLHFRSPWTDQLTLPRGELRSLTVAGGRAGDTPPFSPRTGDELRTVASGTLFGTLTEVNADRVRFTVNGEDRDFDWPEVAAVATRRTGGAPSTSAGLHVRVRLLAGGTDRDVLAGVLKARTGKLTLSHPTFGDLELPADRLVEIRPEFVGRRIVIDTGVHHLGDGLKARFTHPRPDGTELHGEFHAGGGLGDGELIVTGQGELRLDVTLNGRPLGLIDRDFAEETDTPLSVPRGRIKAGKNTVHLRQRSGDCELVGLRIDIPEGKP